MAAGELTMPGLDKKPPKAAERAQTASRAGLALERFFSRPGVDPFSEVEWELRSAVIAGEDGRVVFEQRDVEVPRTWSQTATNVVVSKYFRGALGSPRRESSVRQLIGRVVDTVAGWGERQGYFADDAARDVACACSDALDDFLSSPGIVISPAAMVPVPPAPLVLSVHRRIALWAFLSRADAQLMGVASLWTTYT